MVRVWGGHLLLSSAKKREPRLSPRPYRSHTNFSSTNEDLTGSFTLAGFRMTILSVNEAESHRYNEEERNLLYNYHFTVIHKQPPSLFGVSPHPYG